MPYQAQIRFLGSPAAGGGYMHTTLRLTAITYGYQHNG
jgi:hypothetical protein